MRQDHATSDSDVRHGTAIGRGRVKAAACLRDSEEGEGASRPRAAFGRSRSMLRKICRW